MEQIVIREWENAIQKLTCVGQSWWRMVLEDKVAAFQIAVPRGVEDGTPPRRNISAGSHCP
jgi:hypothetical protein